MNILTRYPFFPRDLPQQTRPADILADALVSLHIATIANVPVWITKVHAGDLADFTISAIIFRQIAVFIFVLPATQLRRQDAIHDVVPAIAVHDARDIVNVFHLPDLGIAHLNLDGNAFESVGVIAPQRGLAEAALPGERADHAPALLLVQPRNIRVRARILE